MNYYRAKIGFENELPNKKTTAFIHKISAKKDIHVFTTDENDVVTKSEYIGEYIGLKNNKLYNNNSECNQDFDKLSKFTTIKINEDQKINLNRIIDNIEIEKVIIKLHNNKSQGKDGLTSEFYKGFREKLSHMLENVFNNIQNSSTDDLRKFNEGIIVLLPKEGIISNFNNIRPITLTNTDKKIFSHLLNNRISSFIDQLVNTDQTGYIRKRNLLDNLYKLDSLIERGNLKGNFMV